MQRDHPFRFKRVKRKAGRVYIVVYDRDPAHPVATGIAVDPADTKNGGPGYQRAVGWAYAHLGTATGPRTVLKHMVADMFTERCDWRRRVTEKGRSFGSGYFPAHRGRFVNYVLPRFGDIVPSQIRPADIDSWLLGLKTREKALTSHALNKLIQTLRIVFDELEYQGVLAQGQNPASAVDYFTDHTRKREPITMAEFHTLFPEDMDELVRIWGTLSWATFFYLMATTGMRPGEVAAMDLSHWIKGVGYPVSQAVEQGTRRIKGLKTSERGVKVKPAWLNDRAEGLLTMMVFQGAPQSGLLFPGEDGGPHPPETSNKHFKASAARAGVDLNGRTQYSLRHFFSTEVAKHVTEDEAAEQLGQKVYRGEYDHRAVTERLKANPAMRATINRIFTPQGP